MLTAELLPPEIADLQVYNPSLQSKQYTLDQCGLYFEGGVSIGVPDLTVLGAWCILQLFAAQGGVENRYERTPWSLL